MRVSESFCLDQEARQLALAESEPLENRRKIALNAAKAWAAEAVAMREAALNRRSPDQLDAAITLEFAQETAASTADPEKLDHGHVQ